MRTFHGLDDLPSDFGPAVVSVGNFDGVHRAHQEVLRRVVERARERKARSLAVTFEPHPMRILRPDIALKLLTPTAVKLRLLARAGLDATLVLPFTRDLSLTPPQDFAHQILARRLRAVEVHEGANFHFGHRAQGNVERLAEFGRKFGFDVVIYPEMRVRGESVSSSRIRELIRAGQVSRARRLLGRVFSIISTAGRGRGYGHKFTVPTINLSRYDELVPGDGVYITRTRVGEVTFDSVSNVGMRPTFGGDSFAVESHLLHFEEMDISAETEVEVAFLFRLRPEIKFPSVEALREQIARDIGRTHRYFALLERHAPTAP
ncbi:MAG TPA: bifunctional riboflavin kinase/FAD synthetase [Terriglobales bacterium]|nr:bifunctional riboflavin kinase/FAD synthetase [Terriglobales bacterium]